MTVNNQPQSVENLLRRAAFTLMEMLVVVAIIVVLAGVGGAYLMGRLEEAKFSTAKAKAKEIANQAKIYKLDHNGMWPINLQAMLEKDQEGKGPYFETSDAILDPWGQAFQYDPSGTRNFNEGGAKVIIPDVFTMYEGRTVGNWMK